MIQGKSLRSSGGRTVSAERECSGLKLGLKSICGKYTGCTVHTYIYLYVLGHVGIQAMLLGQMAWILAWLA